MIPFGISSGRPTSTRHVSGMGLDVGPSWVLVDCGEGTQQQIMRSRLRFGRLKAVLLTHLHGDHVLGLPGLLATLGTDGRTEPFPIVGPVGVARWLEVMLDLPMLGLRFDLEITELDPDVITADPVPIGALAGLDVSTAQLVHRVPSFGFRFVEADRPGRVDPDRARSLGITEGPALGRLQRGETVDGVQPDEVMGAPRPGRIVTILGDTMRADGAVNLAADADLLVHECTYAAAEHELCEQWTHSCTADVASVAVEAGVRAVLLTHFSARYPDPTKLAAEVEERVEAVPITVTAAVEGEPVEVPLRS